MTAPTRSLAAALTISSLMIGGCALRRVDSYLARDVNLASYRTYAWSPVQPGTTGDVRLDNNEIFQERVRAAVEKQLAAHGFEKTAGAPQLLVHYRASVEQRFDVPELEPWELCAECKPFIYDAGTLAIELVDARTNHLLWRGWSNANVDGVVDNQQWLEEHIDEAVAKIFERLPTPLIGRLLHAKDEKVGLKPWQRSVSSLGVYSGKLVAPYETIHAGLGDQKIVTTLCPGGKERMRRLMAMIANRRVDLTQLITHRSSLENIHEAFELFSDQRAGVLKVALFPVAPSSRTDGAETPDAAEEGARLSHVIL